MSTRDTDASALIDSLGKSNNGGPQISLAKTILTIYDPYNGASNPKAIPGSVLEYIITATNNGDLAAEAIKISNLISNNTKLCVSDIGSCKAPYFVDEPPADSGLSLASTASKNNGVDNY